MRRSRFDDNRIVNTRSQLTVILAAAVVLLAVSDTASQSLQIAIVDFYGLRRVSAAQARAVLTIKEGDTVVIAGDARPAFATESERRLAMLPGVLNAHVSLVCCDEGRAIVYVGVEENGSPARRFREAPRGRVRLADDVVQAGRDFSEAVIAAVQRGDAAEDDSSGHSLMHDPAARRIQERFIDDARDLRPLRDVLRHSADAGHRALAAQILGYARNKRDVIDDLRYAMTDPSDDVRNNAMRALAVIARAASAAPQRMPIPIGPFIGLLDSPVWTDRNKASLALMSLSERRDPALLTALRHRALGPLVEMARWQNRGHAMPALLILGRIAGQSDEDVEAAWTRGDRDAVINAALARQ